MPAATYVAIHPSQFPDAIRRDLLDSLRSRQVNHKFHYDSFKQTQKWLALHQAYSPSRTDADCAATYDRAFGHAAKQVRGARVHLVGLGCGGGQKDTRLLELLKRGGKDIFYTPADVSTAMVLVARQSALSIVSPDYCFPLVCDLATMDDLPGVLDNQRPASAARLITFFGMIPNFEPDAILPRLAAVVGGEDYLLFSANLAPGADYPAGVQRVLPQYDNDATRDWLITFLLDLGVDRADGDIRFRIAEGPPASELQRIVAEFHFTRARKIQVDAEEFEFRPNSSIRLFFSYRYTPALVRSALGRYGLRVVDQWITASGEEGVFLVARS